MSAWPGQILALPARLATSLRNAVSWLLRSQLPDYIQINLGERVAEQAAPVPFFWRRLGAAPAPQSLERLRGQLLAVAADPRPKGIVIRVERTSLSLSQAQSLAALIGECRKASQLVKGRESPLRVVFYLLQCNAPVYVAAAAADAIYLGPLTTWELKPLSWPSRYLRRLLDRIGVEFDVVRAGAWKSAMDPLTSDHMDSLNREHMERALASFQSQIVESVAEGRGLAQEFVTDILDRGPLLPGEAVESGLADGTCTWPELPRKLAEPNAREVPGLRPISQVQGLLRRTYRRKFPKDIALISVRGAIVFGTAGSPPLPGRRGQTCTHGELLEAIRKVRERRKRLAGLLLHVDSPGGSALASHVVYEALLQLRSEMPVAVYMGAVAASGGYYIAMGGSYVVAQEATLTGSIGVFLAKPVIGRLLQRLGVHATDVARADNAAIYSSDARWTPAQRERIQIQVDHFYEEFKQTVAAGRGLNSEDLEGLAGGRVWTGRQARDLGLVDETGGILRAVQHIREQAGVPAACRVRIRSQTARRRPASQYAPALISWLSGILPWSASLPTGAVMQFEPVPEAWMLADDLLGTIPDWTDVATGL